MKNLDQPSATESRKKYGMVTHANGECSPCVENECGEYRHFGHRGSYASAMREIEADQRWEDMAMGGDSGPSQPSTEGGAS